NAASFAVVAVVLLGLPPGKAARGEEAVDEEREDGAGGGPAPSWRAATRVAAGPLVLDLATSFAGGGMNVLIVVIAVDVLAAGEAATGYLNAATGVGGVVAGLIAGGLVARRLDVPIVAGAVVGTLGFIALGLTRELPVALVAIAVALGAVLLLDIVNVTLVQRAVPDALRGRVMGIIQTTGTLAMAAGSFALPVLAGRIGVGPVIVGTGLVVASVAGVALVLLRQAGVLEPVAIDPARLAILRHSILGTLPPARLEAAAQRLAAMVVTPGQVIIEQDAPADRFYLIDSGRFAVTQRDAEGTEVPLRVMGPGEVFGEIGLLTGGVRTARVSAETQGRLWALDRDQFLELVSAGAGLSTRLLDLHRGVRLVSE
nr:MFS transporter [Chloroflexota bacterium]